MFITPLIKGRVGYGRLHLFGTQNDLTYLFWDQRNHVNGRKSYEFHGDLNDTPSNAKTRGPSFGKHVKRVARNQHLREGKNHWSKVEKYPWSAWSVKAKDADDVTDSNTHESKWHEGDIGSEPIEVISGSLSQVTKQRYNDPWSNRYEENRKIEGLSENKSKEKGSTSTKNDANRPRSQKSKRHTNRRIRSIHKSHGERLGEKAPLAAKRRNKKNVTATNTKTSRDREIQGKPETENS
ncbi:hypothetical protein RB195_001496 [Necator americanus]|uniref:Thrombospondin type 1 domain protein n=1 Tax=Necator americanus TaxID=51031 RepID=A0ABR1DG50_NECAM